MRFAGLTEEENARIIPGDPVLVAYAGSHAHGTHQPPQDGGIDDVDVIGVYVSPLERYFGASFVPDRGSHVQINEWDCTSYDIRHFVRLALQCNPNVICALWNPPDKYMLVTPDARALIASRSIFSSRRAYKTFAGYADAQIKRMTEYHDQGEDACCVGEKFHSEDCPLRGRHGRGSQKKFATGYMGQKRKALVERFGYDTKNAAHAMRLLAMGAEFLQTGRFSVDRSLLDAGFLMRVKRGDFQLSEIKATAEARFEQLKIASKYSILPDEPDAAAADRLLIDILSRRFLNKMARS